jgi:hypothetical protein
LISFASADENIMSALMSTLNNELSQLHSNAIHWQYDLSKHQSLAVDKQESEQLNILLKRTEAEFRLLIKSAENQEQNGVSNVKVEHSLSHSMEQKQTVKSNALQNSQVPEPGKEFSSHTIQAHNHVLSRHQASNSEAASSKASDQHHGQKSWRSKSKNHDSEHPSHKFDGKLTEELPGSRYFRAQVEKEEDEHQHQYVIGAERESDHFSKDLRHFLRDRRQHALKAELSQALGQVYDLETELGAQSSSL